MALRRPIEEPNPADLAVQISQFGQSIHHLYVHRCSSYARTRFDELAAQLDLVQKRYEGDLVDCINAMLEVIMDVMTCSDADYDDRYYDFWNKFEQLERESFHLYANAISMA